MPTETEIRIIHRRLLQAEHPLARDAMVQAIADQTDASPEEIEAAIGFAETDAVGPAGPDEPRATAATGFAGHATGFAVPGAPAVKGQGE